MTRGEYRIVDCGIRQLRLRVLEQGQMMAMVEARFPLSFLECIEEVLDRFEDRLSREGISDEVQSEPSSSEPFSGSANKTNT